MILLLNILFIAIVLFLGYKRYKNSPIGNYYWPAVLLKLMAGVLVGLLYKFHYQNGDTFMFFDSALELKLVAFSSFGSFIDIYLLNNYEALPNFAFAWIPSAFFVKVLAVLALITKGNYWISGIYLSLFSFFGLWVWTQALFRIFQDKRIAVLAGLFLPSIIFWSSGILKETIAIPALAIICTYFIYYYLNSNIRWYQLLIALISLVVLIVLKYFLAAVLLISTSTIVLSRRLLKKEGKWQFEVGVVIIIFLLVAGGISLLHPNLWPARIAEVIYNNYQGYMDNPTSGYLVEYTSFEPTLFSMLLNIPKAVIVGLFSPLIPIPGASLSILAVVENWLMVLGSLGLLLIRPLPKSRSSRLAIWGCLLFVILAAGLIALATPNLGTLARYKTGFMLVYAPFAITGLFSLYKKIVQLS